MQAKMINQRKTAAKLIHYNLCNLSFMGENKSSNKRDFRIIET